MGKLNFLTRDIARGRLKKLNPAYRQVAITLLRMKSASPWITSRRYGHRRRVHLVLFGPDGGKVNADMQLAGRRLAQTFTSADGRRVNDYTLSPDGRTLTMQVDKRAPDCLITPNKFTDECPERGTRTACPSTATPVVCHPFRLNAEANWLSRSSCRGRSITIDCGPRYVLGCFRSISGNGTPISLYQRRALRRMHDLKHLLDTLTAQSA